METASPLNAFKHYQRNQRPEVHIRPQCSVSGHRGEPTRVSTVQLGASLAGKVSSRLSSTLSSAGASSARSDKRRRLRPRILGPGLDRLDADGFFRGIAMLPSADGIRCTAEVM